MPGGENSIELRATFSSPDEAIPAANALVEAGFTDVRLFVVMEATVSGTSEELQRVHDRVKEIPDEVLGKAEVTGTQFGSQD